MITSEMITSEHPRQLMTISRLEIQALPERPEAPAEEPRRTCTLVRGEPSWAMPGLGAGIDAAPIVIGLVVASASILFMVTGRLADEADGVV